MFSAYAMHWIFFQLCKLCIVFAAPVLARAYRGYTNKFGKVADNILRVDLVSNTFDANDNNNPVREISSCSGLGLHSHTCKNASALFDLDP